jgi:hypothetical protein
MKSFQFLKSIYRLLPHVTRLACFLFVVFLISASQLAAQQNEAPKRFPDAKITDCSACHGAKSPLPKDHPDPASMNLKACRECHAKGSPTSLSGKLPLSHVHQLAGNTCASCHADPKKPEAVPAKDCLKCHDMEKVSAATAEVKPSNPHNSPHYGKNSDCNLCHHQHEKSENYCSQCHSFKFDVP